MPRYPFARFLTYALFACAIVSLLGTIGWVLNAAWTYLMVNPELDAVLGRQTDAVARIAPSLMSAFACLVGAVALFAIRAGLQILMDLEADTRAGRATPEPERQTPELTAAAWD